MPPIMPNVHIFPCDEFGSSIVNMKNVFSSCFFSPGVCAFGYLDIRKYEFETTSTKYLEFIIKARRRIYIDLKKVKVIIK